MLYFLTHQSGLGSLPQLFMLMSGLKTEYNEACHACCLSKLLQSQEDIGHHQLPTAQPTLVHSPTIIRFIRQLPLFALQCWQLLHHQPMNQLQWHLMPAAVFLTAGCVWNNCDIFRRIMNQGQIGVRHDAGSALAALHSPV